MSDAALRVLEAEAVRDMGPTALLALSVARGRAGLCTVVSGPGKPVPVQGPREKPPDFAPSVLSRKARPHRTTISVGPDGLCTLGPFVPTIVVTAHLPGAHAVTCRGGLRNQSATGKGFSAIPGSCTAVLNQACADAHRGGVASTWRQRALVYVRVILAAMPEDATDREKRARLLEERWGNIHATGMRAWQEATRMALTGALHPRRRSSANVGADAVDVPLFGGA